MAKRKPSPKNDNHAKGLAYEKAFEAYMLEQLGFDRVDHRSLVRVKDSNRAIETDLFGVKTSMAWTITFIFGITLVLLCAMTSMIALFGSQETNAFVWNAWLSEKLNLGALDSRLEQAGISLLAVIVYIPVIVAALRTNIRIWVECRNWQAKIKVKYLFELKESREQAKKYRTTDEVWIVSSSGFDAEALRYARENKIHCIHFPHGGTPRIVNDLPSRVLKSD